MSTQRELKPIDVDADGAIASSTIVTGTRASDGHDHIDTRAHPHVHQYAGVVVVPELTPGPTVRPRVPAQPERSQVYVAPGLHGLVTTVPLGTPQETHAAKERRDLNEVVHRVLIVGLAISTALMLAGVGLNVFYQRDLPTVVPDIGDVISRVLALRPSGFLALGLLVLIATPILRVIGSIGAFLYERDWRYAGVGTLVLLVLLISLVLGRG
jgi:uncharacterized membrane protein